MPTNRELDAKVAERIMGQKPWKDTEECSQFTPGARWVYGADYYECDVWYIETPDDAYVDLPCYSTDIASAWQVVERLRDMWTAATAGVSGLDNDFPRPFDDVEFFEVLHRHADRRWPWAMLYVTPEAICTAALRAVAAPPAATGEGT